MEREQSPQGSPGLAAQLAQWAPIVKNLVDRLKPVIDQPVIRVPYNMPLAASRVVAAAATNVPLLASDFSNSLEWPFEIWKVKFSQDPAHTFRDWRFFLRDQQFSQDLMKAAAMVATLVDDNTGVWRLELPWIVRPKGGGLGPTVDNLDAINPITVDVNFQGYLLIPRA